MIFLCFLAVPYAECLYVEIYAYRREAKHVYTTLQTRIDDIDNTYRQHRQHV